jgi:voltage-gated potassium channel
MDTQPTVLFWRKLRASWRDTLLLLREFRLPLIWFTLVMTGSGWLYFVLSSPTEYPIRSLPEGIYTALTLTFFQASIPFPTEWYLQIFFFALPVVGISILAQGLADFGFILFNRRLRGKDWEMAVASTFHHHVVLIGLGHLGFRVVKQLNDLQQDVVVIESNPKPDLLASVRAMGVPVIEDDGTREAALAAAGVKTARSILLCTQDDSLNLRMALKARSLNPKIDVVIRIFDDDFASSLQSQFGFHAFSATGMAAPLFAAVAAEMDITPPITIEGQPHILARMQIKPRSHLIDLTVGAIEENFRVSIVLLCSAERQEFHPGSQEPVCAGQTLAIFGKPEEINRLMHANKG